MSEKQKETAKITENRELEEADYRELDSLDKKIISLRTAFPAMSAEAIGRRLNCHGDTIRKRLEKEYVKRTLERAANIEFELALENRREVLKVQRKAISLVGELLDSTDPQIQQLALSKIDIMKGIIPDLTENTNRNENTGEMTISIVGVEPDEQSAD